jgi:hypothetical protein
MCSFTICSCAKYCASDRTNEVDIGFGGRGGISTGFWRENVKGRAVGVGVGNRMEDYGLD